MGGGIKIYLIYLTWTLSPEAAFNLVDKKYTLKVTKNQRNEIRTKRNCSILIEIKDFRGTYAIMVVYEVSYAKSPTFRENTGPFSCNHCQKTPNKTPRIDKKWCNGMPAG